MTERENPLASPQLSIDSEGIARLVFDAQGKSANVLTEQVMDRLAGALSEIKTSCESSEIQGVLISSAKPSSFIVGADIDAIAGVDDPNAGAEAARTGQAIYLELERLPVPTVAAIHGPCVGGGTELALACGYRLASDAPETKIGLPEVQLGILPAWGGTTRLPRLIGLRHALDLLLTGELVSGGRAKGLGLVDDVFPHDLFLELAEAFLRDRVRDGRPSARARRGVGTRLLEDTAPGRRVLITMARRRVLQQTGGHYPAPLRILDVLRSSMSRSLDRALEAEALAAGELIASRISKNLVHIFKLREGARKGVGAETTVPTEIHQIAVVGAGTMGGALLNWPHSTASGSGSRMCARRRYRWHSNTRQDSSTQCEEASALEAGGRPGDGSDLGRTGLRGIRASRPGRRGCGRKNGGEINSSRRTRIKDG